MVDVLAVAPCLAGGAVLVDVAHALGQGELARVVQQGAEAEGMQLVFGEAEEAAHQQGDDGDVEPVRGGAVARRRLLDGAHGQVAVRHGGEQGTHEPVARRPGLGRLVRDEGQHPGALGGGGLEAGLQRQLGVDRRAVDRRARLEAGRLGIGTRHHHLAQLGTPADVADAQGADRLELVRVGDAKGVARERVRHPADIEVDEHADAERLHVDRFGGLNGCHGPAVIDRPSAGLTADVAAPARP